jgi:four helix bundle protein
MKTHKDLDAWKNSISLVTDVYKLTSSFPKEEVYSLTSQIRRSAVSIPSNIAEGAGRNHKKEFIQYLYIALGSMSELETQMLIACNLEYVPEKVLVDFNERIKIISNQILGLIKYLKNKS